MWVELNSRHRRLCASNMAGNTLNECGNAFSRLTKETKTYVNESSFDGNLAVLIYTLLIPCAYSWRLLASMSLGELCKARTEHLGPFETSSVQ